MARAMISQVLIVVFAVVIVGLSHCDADEAAWEFVDIHGVTHSPFEQQSNKAIALVFISTDCPIANGYQPTLRRLRRQYQDQGVSFFLIHPHTDVTVDECRAHAEAYKIEAPVIIDQHQWITQRVHASVTPEAVVIVPGVERPVYQGRIDDLYARYGKKRRRATSHDLAEALDAVLAGTPVKRPKTKAIGCFIPRLAK